MINDAVLFYIHCTYSEDKYVLSLLLNIPEGNYRLNNSVINFNNSNNLKLINNLNRVTWTVSGILLKLYQNYRETHRLSNNITQKTIKNMYIMY